MLWPMLHAEHRWRERSATSDAVAELEHELALSPLLARLLVIRGLCDPDRAQAFIDKRLRDLHPPEQLADMDAASQRLAQAITRRERILIHGDFDVDGSTATALLVLFCRACSHDAIPWIPHRQDDGYGLGPSSLKAVVDERAELMITVDCGIIDDGWAARIEAETRCEVVVTDHHLPAGPLPRCRAVVNPNRPDCRYPDKGLAGVALAWKLAWATGKVLCGSERLSDRLRAFLLESLSLVAIGTVADCAPLDCENRLLVHHGLRALERSTNPGLRALCDGAKVKDQISANDIGWRLGPLLNASGRLGSALDNVALLTCKDPERARQLVAGLVRQNEERRRLTEILTTDLIEEITTNPAYESRRALVFAGDGWHPGVVGIVANRLAERFAKPSAIIAIDGDTGKGSLRTAANVHLGHAIDACRAHLIAGGGHAKAAGISIRPDQVDAFSRAFERYVHERDPNADAAPGIDHDGIARIEELDAGFIAALASLEPYGIGNPAPVLRLDGVHFVSRPELFGRQGNHLRGALSDHCGGMRPFLAWRGQRHFEHFCLPHQRFDMLVRPELDRWRGETRMRLVFVDGKSQ